MLQKIKNKLGLFFLRRKMKYHQRKVQVCNLESANKIGVLFDLENDKNYTTIKAFLKYLREEEGVRKVRALGYSQSKEIPVNYIPNAHIDFYCQKDLNSYLKPNAVSTTNFEEEDFDILIDLSTDFYLPIKFLFESSNAKFKVGRFCDKIDFQTDLMIDIKELKSLRYYIEQLTHYLKMINRKNNAA